MRWHLLGMGNEIDVHTPHWHGETVTDAGKNTDVIELLPGSMKTVDMVADNPGTWMFHCHVEDHMEAGMMAVYMIYVPPTRSCPITFVAGDFWKNQEISTLTVKNTSDKPIANLTVTSEMLLAPQDLQRPYNAQWSSNKTILPGQELMLEKQASHSASAQTVIGWVFFPSVVKYQDGSTWQSQSEGECFKVIWRDLQHPDLPALPPRQAELNAD